MRNHRPKSSAERIAQLRALPVFANFDDSALAKMDRRLTDLDVPVGSVLLSEGQPGREAFIIMSGRAEIRVGDQVVGHVGDGDLVGEMALLDTRPRSATVVAVTPMHLLVMDPSEFASLLDDPRSARWIAASLSNRLRDADEHK